MEKKTNKKSLVAVIVLVAVIALLAGFYAKFKAKPVEGQKKITIEVVNKEGEKKDYPLKTDAEFLKQAMEECKDLSFEENSGMVMSVNGEVADYSIDQSYWAIYVNDDYGMYGIAEQPVTDGDTYKFEYTVYAE